MIKHPLQVTKIFLGIEPICLNMSQLYKLNLQQADTSSEDEKLFIKAIIISNFFLK